jgi:mannose-6-phosphate isomerase-like protein (cupin superfamily)
MAQNPAQVDPKHYKVEFENDRVRVLRIRYEPGEQSQMHGHPESVLVSLTDAHARFTYPDGKTEEFRMKAGEAMFAGPTEHQPENISNQPLELFQIELK